jgi:hypothetical protein
MAAFIPYDNQWGHDKFERFVMTRICHDSSKYSRRLQLGEDATEVQKIVHSLQDAGSAAAKARNDQATAKAIADARKHQENEGFEQVVGLRNGRSVSANADDLFDRDNDDDDVLGDDEDGLNGDGLDGSEENARCPHASSLGAQPTACGNVASRLEKRVLLEQQLAKSLAKDPDGDCWFGPGEKPKKA